MFPLNSAGKEPRERCYWGKAESDLGLLLRLCHGAVLSVHRSVNSHLWRKQSTKQKNKLNQSFLQAVPNEFSALLYLIFLPFWKNFHCRSWKGYMKYLFGSCAMKRTRALAIGRRISEHVTLWSMVVSNKIEGNWIEIKISCGAVAIFFKEGSLVEEILFLLK